MSRIELRETNLVKYYTNKKTPTQQSAVQGEIPNTRPKSVATPLPPLKSAQIGKICPNTPASPRPIWKPVLAVSLST